MSILTASIAQVNLGAFSVDGLMDQNGKFYIGIPQLVTLQIVPPNRSAKQLQALTGAGFQTNGIKLKTPLNSKAINAIPIECFEELLFDLSLSGNKKAIQLSRALIRLSLTQVFSDAFGQKFEKVDRDRMQSRIGVEDGSRDFLEFDILLRLERAQDRLITYMEIGLFPYDALKKLKVEIL